MSDGLHKRRQFWCYRLRIDGRLRELSTRTTNYAEARRIRAAAVEAERLGRLPTDLSRARFEAVAADWLAGRKLTVAPRTYRWDRDRLKPVLKAFGGRRLEELTGDLLRQFQLRRVTQVAASTVNIEMATVRAVLQRAKLWNRVTDDIRPLRVRNSGGPGRALSPEDEARLWATARSRPDGQVAYWCGTLAANTTMRGCEIKGLHLSDVDLIEGFLTIRRDTSKTDAGCRRIPVNAGARAALGLLLQRANRLGAVEPEHFLLPARRPLGTYTGGLIADQYDPARPQATWRTAWRGLTRAAGLRGLRFHDLRHTAITKLAEAGVPDLTLMSIAGHVSRSMLERYSHIRVQAKRDAVDKLSPVAFPVEPEPTPVLQ